MAIATIRKAFFLQLLISLFLVSSLTAQDQNIGGTLTGEPLLEYLRDNYTPNSTLGYNTARDRMYTILDNFDGVVICVYTYFEVPVDPESDSPRADAFTLITAEGDTLGGINAEHLWPQSKGASSEPARSDLHSLYASEIRVNQDRASFKFGNIDDGEVEKWYNKVNRDTSDDIFSFTAPPEAERGEWSKLSAVGPKRFEAKDDTKGDIARAMFYFYTIYRTEADAADPGFFDSMYEDLLTWHDFDEVDEYEVWRTETIEGWQGNVNPFVMDTTLVRRAYFSDDGGDAGDPEPEPEDEITEVIFYESFGVHGSGNTAIASYTGYDNAELSFEGSGTIRESIASSGYEGASGNGLMFVNTGEQFFTIGNINTEGYIQINLSFGAHIDSNDEAYTIEYSINDGASWNPVNNAPSSFSTTWQLFEIEDTGIPAAEDVSIRFSKDNSRMYRLDDITMIGVVPVTEPEENASNLSATEISSSSAKLNWDSGDGNRRLVVMRQGSAPVFIPDNDNSYSANASFGDGEEVTTDEFIVYNGAADQVTVTNLDEDTEYYFTVIEFNGGADEEKYLTTGLPSSNFTTIEAPSGPEVIFYESFGSAGSTTQIASHNFDNDELSFEGNGDVRESIASSGYEGASGNGLVFMNQDYRYLTIGNINTTGYNQIDLSYAIHAGNSTTMDIEFSTDGDSWTAIPYETTQPTNTWTLFEIEDTGIPESESVQIRFSKDNGQQYRLDDVTLSGIVSSEETYTYTVTGNAGWRMLALPVDGISIADLATQNSIQGITGSFNESSSPNFYSGYDGNSWILPNNTSDEIASGNGFIWYFFDNDIEESKSLPFDISVTGETPTEEFDVSLNESGDKWIILGNPFSDAIEFENLGNNVIGGTLASNNYAVWDGSSYESLTLGVDQVEPFQAFLIQNDDASAFRFFPEDQISLGASQNQEDYRRISFSLIEKTDKENPLIDKDAKVFFHESAHEGQDKYDFTKLKSLNDTFIAVALVDDSNNQTNLKSIDSYHYDLQEELQIPLYLESQNFSGKAELHLTDLFNIPQNWQIKIRDRKTGALESLPLEIDMSDFITDQSTSSGLELQPADNANLRYDVIISPSEITSVLPDDNLPTNIQLSQNYPNPFNPTTTIAFALPEDQMVTLRIFDMLGREVAVLLNEVRSAGNHQVTWDASSASSGMYMYQIETSNRTMTKKMTLIK